ncbi:MAG: short-chain fatty acyl-CoA regulator family protein [Aliishimia sp.]
MAADTLTGSRIRERRLISGLRQADLAREIGISASYLNLIEHNRRRIGGKLLVSLATALGVEPSMLTEGAEATLIAALREAEASTQATGAELDRIEDLAGRFPGWARVLAALHSRTLQLEQSVEGLNDRLTHDPKLAASVHEVLSTATSIRSTASILAETDQLEPEWLDRFHANINEDSARLAESSRMLAGYLEGGQERPQDGVSLPQDEVDAFLTAREFSFPQLEIDGDLDVSDVLQASGLSAAAEVFARVFLDIYVTDAKVLPIQTLREVLRQSDPDPDPVGVAAKLGVAVPIVLRRLASLPEVDAGYVMCDRSGSLLWRRPIAGFTMPRFGAACPLWPIFAAFSQTGAAIRTPVMQAGRQQTRFTAYAMAEVAGPTHYNVPPLLRAGMLLLPDKSGETAPETVTELGAACRVCSRASCHGRREPSVLLSRG